LFAFENGKRFTGHVILKYIHTVSANKTIVTIQIDESMKGATTVREYLRLSLCAIGNLLHGWKQGPWPRSIIRGQSLAVDHWRSIKRYRRSDLDLPGLPGPDDESSPTNQLPTGPTFKALASGGVHTPWWDLLFGEAGRINTNTNESVLSVRKVTS